MNLCVIPARGGSKRIKKKNIKFFCGKPIIATDVPGCREIVHDGENGVLVPLKDSNSLADAIKELVNNPNKRERMGENGRRLVEREFSEEIVAFQTSRVYWKFLV